MVDAEPNCRGTAVCGFTIGDRVAAVDVTGRTWFGTLRGQTGTLLEVETTAIDSATLPATGAMLTPIEQSTYSLAVDRVTGTPRLMVYDGHLSDSPLVDHVVRLAFEYFGESAPPVLVEGEAAVPWLRASYGPLPPGADVDGSAGRWPPGENCTFAVVEGRHMPRLATLGGSALTPIPPAMLTDGPWCPDAASPDRFDADLLRIRRVDIRLRVQVSYPWMRGPASLRFLNGGSGRAESRLVPDQEIRFAVTPRNLLSGGVR
jgi:hypothetical protein